MVYTNSQQGSSSLTVNEFPRFISENDKHLRVKSNIFTNVAKISYKIPILSKKWNLNQYLNIGGLLR